MIIKPKVRGNGARLADYLLNSKKNDKADLVEMRGFHVPTLKGSLGLIEAMAEKTQCEKPFYHVSYRLARGETLTPEQWQKCADRLEEKLGLENQPRAVVMHTKNGEQHMHVVWSRIDERTMTAINMFKDWPRCQETARELEREFGLKQVRDRNSERRLDAPTFNEDQQARRKGQKLQEKREAIRSAWERSDNGKSFVAALGESGFMLAKGDRRDFVAVDERGSLYTIGKRTTGATAAQVRLRLHDLDREMMPTIEAAREIQQERARKQQQAMRTPDDSAAAFLEHQATKREERAAATREAAQQAPEAAAEKREAHKIEDAAGKSLNKVGNIAGRLTSGFLKAVDSCLDFLIGAPEPRKITPDEYLKSAEARREYNAQQRAVRARGAVLDRWQEQLEESGNDFTSLSPADLQHLNKIDLQNIKAKGEETILGLLEERDRLRYREMGWERERER